MNVEAYIAAHKNAWADTTIKSTRAQLMKYESAMTEGPEALYHSLQHLGAYSRLTTYQRLASYAAWKGDHSFNQWRKFNAKLFKNTYVSKRVAVDFQTALSSINAIEDSPTRERALQILHGALRWTDSIQVPVDGFIVGKGTKVRPSLVEYKEYQKSYDTFRRALKKATGLTPHDLRKLAITRADANGATPADLCEIAGWSSIATAYRYIQPRRVEMLKGLLK